MPESEQHQESLSSHQLLIATSGHVDHGKTSLIKHLTGTDTDTLEEERFRGLTINPGFAYHHFSDPNNPGQDLTLGFVDVPGHADFIPNMLTGVGSVAHAMLVVACDDGIMPQTLEHISILRLLGISNITVALSKIDRSTDAEIEVLEKEIRSLLESQKFEISGSFPVNNLSGEGSQQLLDHLKILAENSIGSSTANSYFQTRFLIDRSFSVKGIGTVVTGTLRHGVLNTQDKLLLSSSGEETRIRGMRLDQRDVNQLAAGQRAALNLNLEYQSVSRGDWLLAQASYTPSLRMDAELSLLDVSTSINSGTQYHLYLGASHHIANLRVLDQEKSLYQIRTQEPVYAHHGDRFVIRDPAAKTTIGGGKIIDVLVPRRGRSSKERLHELRIKTKTAFEALEELLDWSPIGIGLDEYATNYDLTDDGLTALISQLAVSPISLTTNDSVRGILISQEKFDNINELIESTLKEFHLTNQSKEGVDLEKLKKLSKFTGSSKLLESCANILIQEGQLRRSGTILCLASHIAKKSPEEEKFLSKIQPLLKKSGRVPPRTRELVEATGIPLKPLEKILKECVKSQILIQVANNRFYLPETVAELAAFTENLANENAGNTGFTVIQFRDATGIGRNLCIEILEYFDRIGFTRRDENVRFLRVPKNEIFT